MATLRAFFLLAVALAWSGDAEARARLAAVTKQWVLPYKKADQAVTIPKGGTVVLTWNSKIPHNVVKFRGKPTFDQCTFIIKGVLLKPNVSSTTKGSFTIKYPGKGKTVFYGCSVSAVKGVGGHCLGGQKIAITGK